MNKVPKWLRVVIPGVLIVIWMSAGAIGGPYFGKISEVSEVDLAAFLPDSAEATKVNQELKRFRSETTLPALVVFESKSTTLSDNQKQQIDKASEAVASIDAVNGDISPPIVSDSGKAAFILVPIDSGSQFREVIANIKQAVDKSNISNISYKVTGPAGFAADLNKAFAGIDGFLLVTALSAVFVILLFVYRSVLLPIIVLMTSMLALCASILVVFYLAKQGIVELNGQVQGILFILVIGAATDYSLLYVSRYREELYHEPSKWVATHKALRGSLEPIIASGGTVIAGLLCLLISDLASNQALGPVGSIGVAFAILSALTFLPAILFAIGRASFWPVRPLATEKAAAKHAKKLEKGVWNRFGRIIDAYPRRVWIITAVFLATAAFFAPQIKAEGVPQSELILGYSEAREGQKLLTKYFPDGAGSPAYVIAKSENLDALIAKIDTLEGIDGVNVVATGVDAGFKPLGKSEQQIRDEIRKEVEDELTSKKAELEQQMMELEAQAGPFVADAAREQALAAIPSADELVNDTYPFKDAVPRVENGEVLMQATLSDSPDSDKAKETIVRLREEVKKVDSSAVVGGVTAIQYDTNQASIRDRQIIIPLVLVVITFILMLLLRSIVAPILLLATTVLSFAASIGVAALLFNDLWKLPGADPSVILYAFVFLVALGIDYNIFLMTRVREEAVKAGTSKGVIRGLVVTGGVITSAGIVLAATFAALGVIPIVFLAQLAFIVAFGVLLDTFVVRSLLVPALIRDIGPFVWWPSKLRRRP